MTVEEIRNFCLKLPGVTEDIKWSDHLCFSVRGKMFLVTSPDNVPPSASIKVTDENFDTLTSRKGIIPAPYIAKNKWVFLQDIGLFSDKDWLKVIDEAYRIVGAKLSLKLQRQLGLSPVVLEKKTKKPVKKAAKKKGSGTSKK